jgi:hypothetical protein
MGVWSRPKEEHVVDFQPPPYSEHWQYSEDVTVLDSEDEKKEVVLLGYESGSTDHGSRFLADQKVSPYYDSGLRQRQSRAKVEQEAINFTSKSKYTTSHRRICSEDSNHSSHSSKKSWLRSLRKKHARKRSKGSCTLAQVPGPPKFKATLIHIHPPKIRNKIILGQDTISLFDPTGRSHFEASPFTISLETTLLENRPYTICSPVLQRAENRNFESALGHFEILDLETGYVLSEKSLPPSPPTKAEQVTKRGFPKAIALPNPAVHRNTCTELAPHLASQQTLTCHPSPSKSSTERLLDGLRITDPTLLVGRRLKLRLKPSVVLWSAKTMQEVFGFEDVVGSWPDLYGLPLVLKCSEDGDDEGGAEFKIVESEKG